MPEEEDPLGTILYSTAVRPLLGKKNALNICISVSDPDPCGALMKWHPWIRIRIGYKDPDPGQSKLCPKSSVPDSKLIISDPDPLI